MERGRLSLGLKLSRPPQRPLMSRLSERPPPGECSCVVVRVISHFGMGQLVGWGYTWCFGLTLVELPLQPRVCALSTGHGCCWLLWLQRCLLAFCAAAAITAVVSVAMQLLQLQVLVVSLLLLVLLLLLFLLL